MCGVKCRLPLQAAHEVIALAGFHIKRQEFEPEYDNEAEIIVADMEFNDDDTEVCGHQYVAVQERLPMLFVFCVDGG